MTADALFICNTYMQLITAAQIQLRLRRGAGADLLLSDHCAGAAEVARALAEAGPFRRVRLLSTKRLVYARGAGPALADALRLALGRGGESEIWGDADYGALFYFNLDCVAEAARQALFRRGRAPRCCRFEEGVLSYGALTSLRGQGRRARLALGLRGALGRANLAGETRDIYCYYPELLPPSGDFERHAVPLLRRDQRDLLRALNRAFRCEPAREPFPQRYIYFGSAADVDGHRVGEAELVLALADLVGRENLLFKPHPRDGRDFCERNGIAVARNPSAPWELTQLNREFRGHVFLTLSSGSALNASAMLGDDVPIFYLYPLVRGRSAAFDRFCEESVAGALRALRARGLLPGARVAKDLREVLT